MNESDLAPYLEPTYYIDSDGPEVRAFADRVVGEAADPVTRAVRLFHAIRDGVRYDPYSPDLSPEIFRASNVLTRASGFCVPKAIALAAVARAAGVPSRLGFADVRNHLATQRLRERMGTDLFVFHGYVEMWLGGRWVKATPTFNLSLCEKFRVEPLDFDGVHDALFHPFDRDGQQHMQYVRARGEYADFPLELMLAAWREAYPHLFGDGTALEQATERFETGDFESEAALENPPASSLDSAERERS